MDRIEKFANANKFSVQTDNSIRIFSKRDLIRGGFKPEKGSQVFVGRLPSDAYEDEIYSFFSGVGEIFQIKLILKLSGETKGFAFVTFVSAELASKAVKYRNGCPLRPNNPVYVSISTDYRVLLLKNAQGENATPHQIKKVFHKIAKTEVHSSDYNTFAIEFPEHHLAYRALKELGATKKEIWGQFATLEWKNGPQEYERLNEQKRLRRRQLADQKRIEEIEKELCHVRMLEKKTNLPAKYQLRFDGSPSPDSGNDTCPGSDGAPTPRCISPIADISSVADTAHSTAFYRPGSDGAPTPRCISPIADISSVADTAHSTALYRPAIKTKPFCPLSIRFLDRSLRVEKTKCISPYYTTPEAAIKNDLQKFTPNNIVGTPFKESKFASSYRTADTKAEIEKLLQKYMLADGQDPPFEKSKLASVYWKEAAGH